MLRPDSETQQKLAASPSPAERLRIRRASVRAGAFFALGFLLVGAASRLGILHNFPWLQMDAPGPLTIGWWLRFGGMSFGAGVIFGFLLGKMLRFPHTSAASDA